MTDFKERLKQELKSEVPFTKEMGERMMQNRPMKRKKNIWPIFTSGAVVAVAAMLFFLIQTSEDTKYLYNTASSSMQYDEMIDILKENEIKVPLLKDAVEGQQVVEDADVNFQGQSYSFSYHHVIVEEAEQLERGDYVLFEQEDGSKYVRQVVGFEGETYKLSEGNVYINDKQLLLPGYLNSENYLETDDLWKVAVYFEILPNYFEDKEVEAELGENEILISGIEKQKVKVQSIAADSVVGKVVGVKELTPTFDLTGEEAEIYEQLKADLDVTHLAGVDPLTSFRIFKQAEMEGEYELIHILVPSYATINGYGLEDIRKLFSKKNDFTEREWDSIYASSYNGLPEATYEIYNSTAYVHYTYPTKKGLTITAEMQLNAQGFWEYRLHY